MISQGVWFNPPEPHPPPPEDGHEIQCMKYTINVEASSNQCVCLAGFLSSQEIHDYQQAVLDVNTEEWLDILREETFPSCYCPLLLEDANLFISVYERHFKNVDPQQVSKVEWQTTLSKSEKHTLDKMAARLEVAMATFTSEGSHVFVKTSSRSAKDAPMVQDKFVALYKTELHRLNEEEQRKENQQITCLLRAAFEAMKVKKSEEVIDMFMCSERIYQDMLLAVQHEERFCEHFVIRKFVHIDVDMEFRGFVFGQQLRAVSQYNYLIFSARLAKDKDSIMEVLQQFFDQQIQPKFKDSKFPDNYIIDFAVCENGKYSPL